MATERQARLARDLHQQKLVKGGVHALSVERVGQSGKKFGVVAWVKQAKGKIPEALDIMDRGTKVRVPVVIRESKPFQLE
jgi:hypothetical protein